MVAAIKRPGWIRGPLGAVLAAAFGFGLVVVLREISGLPIFQTEQTGYPHVVVPLITGPLGFLVGFGCFDYWLRWAAGMPTIPEDHSQHGAKSWKDYFHFNTDHKVIGIQYIVTTFFFFFVGGLMAMLIRAELAQPGTQIVDAATYNSLFSTHAVLMIFVFVIPVFAGIANYVLPLMIGAPDMAFPRLNALSFWMLPLAGLLFIGSFLAPGGAFDAGWTGYAPLSTGAPLGQSFFNLGVQFAGASSIATALNFLVTIITMRAPGMTFWRMPLLVWANLSTSLLVVAATPFIAGAQFMVLFDRVLGTQFFQFAGGGDVVSYQHIFWFYSHPAVYIMMLPGFGIISEVISTHARKPIFGYRLMALALIGIVVLSYSVWAHHMFVAGMFSWLRVPMMITTLLIAVPTGIKIFSWLGTLYFGKIHTYSTAMLFALAFIVTFTIGGISGVMLGMVPIDIHVSDTYFIVAHIHFVLFGGSVFTIFAGIYHWFPKMTGRMYDEKLGRVHFWGTLVGTWVTFIPMHWVGMDGMPRRVADYATQFGDWNLLISCGAFILGAVPARLPLQHGRQLALRPARRRQIPGGRTRSSGRSPRRRRSSTSTRSRASSAAPTSSACPAPATRSWPARAPRSPNRSRAWWVSRERRDGCGPAAAGLPQRGGRRAQAAAGGARAGREGPLRRRRRAAEPAGGRPADRRRRAPRRRPRPGRGDDVDPRRVRDRVGRRGDGPRPGAGARRRGPRPRARRGAALLPGRAPASASPARTWSSGPRPASSRRSTVTHIPVRIDDDSIRWDVIHTLVVATQTVATPDLVSRLKERAAERPHRYTIICPRSEDVTEAEIVRDLASTLAELYRADVDATGQPMSPDPFHAVQNAIEHYRIDEVLISTFAGEESRWLEEDLIGRVREITEKPVEHLEVGRPAEAVAAAVAEGGEA